MVCSGASWRRDWPRFGSHLQRPIRSIWLLTHWEALCCGYAGTYSHESTMTSHSGFDKLAPFYRLMEKLVAGKILQEARTAHTDKLQQPSNVLMLGEGPGRLLAHLLDRLPSAHFLVMDQSQGMLNQALKCLQRTHSDCSRITWLNRNILTQDIPDGPYDLITTPFFLDCFTQDQLDLIIPSIASRSAQQCHWLLIDFQIPATGKFRSTRARCVHRLMYTFFRIITGIDADHVVEPDSLMEAAGFRRLSRLEFNAGLIRSDLWRRVGKISGNGGRPHSIRRNEDSSKEYPDSTRAGLAKPPSPPT
jgi:ubiquinone/menaquinone biosynthesis C-methylase UbiE